ncbi:MAG: putative endonuclease lcl3 [Bogoriella megaspora]|nr:MAG: putative endonuclease lcl3 [Bogoriella megaspora]
MRWPWSSNPNPDPDSKDTTASNSKPTLWTYLTTPSSSTSNPNPVSWSTTLNSTNYAHQVPQTIIAASLISGTSLLFLRFWKSYLRRLPTVDYIPPRLFRRRSLLGKVTSVGDGDNFRMYHTPGGRLAGWGWLPGRKVPVEKEGLRGRTLHIRLAGVDAPERAHFGRPAQPYSDTALNWLTAFVLNRRVRAYIYRRDQYDRVVATVYVRTGLWRRRRDIGEEMLKRGLATVYEAKNEQFMEFGEKRERYQELEKRAKTGKVGMWGGRERKGMWGKVMSWMGVGGKEVSLESPREYKTRMLKEEAAAGKESS